MGTNNDLTPVINQRQSWESMPCPVGHDGLTAMGDEITRGETPKSKDIGEQKESENVPS